MMILCCRAQLKKTNHIQHLMQQTKMGNFCFGYARSIYQWWPKSSWPNNEWNYRSHFFFQQKIYLWQKLFTGQKRSLLQYPLPPTPNWINSSSNTGTKFYRKRDPIQNLLHQINKKTYQTFMNNFVTFIA